MAWNTVNVLIAICVITASSQRLDPKVFEALAKLPMPEVGNNFSIKFNFTTDENVLLDATSRNATYDVRLMSDFNFDSSISLFIPVEEINMKGVYFSSIQIPFENGQQISQSNSGTYKLTLRNVHLTFTVVIQFFLDGPALTLTHCHPLIGEADMRLQETDNNRKHPLSMTTLTDLLNLVSAEEYRSMFCNAMAGLTKDRSSPIIQAVLRRILTGSYPKSA
ncbi:uncharacterized protein LOC143447183 isoform X3 [Clavelina lepadiformis]|uniref:Uncharacterized protein n=1 Tax=Clavelina lepadiformis TaxID=159417 RepID=A0ABP0GR56_CLALP